MTDNIVIDTEKDKENKVDEVSQVNIDSFNDYNLESVSMETIQQPDYSYGYTEQQLDGGVAIRNQYNVRRSVFLSL